jgi:hypothetical protein
MDTARFERLHFPQRATQGEVVAVPVSDATYKTLQAAARARGISLTLWARGVLLRAAAETPRNSKSLAAYTPERN